jgi:hypothetical protein
MNRFNKIVLGSLAAILFTAMTVKTLDVIVYEMYRELYGLRDIRASNYNLNSFTADDKKGHCC